MLKILNCKDFSSSIYLLSPNVWILVGRFSKWVSRFSQNIQYLKWYKTGNVLLVSTYKSQKWSFMFIKSCSPTQVENLCGFIWALVLHVGMGHLVYIPHGAHKSLPVWDCICVCPHGYQIGNTWGTWANTYGYLVDWPTWIPYWRNRGDCMQALTGLAYTEEKLSHHM